MNIIQAITIFKNETKKIDVDDQNKTRFPISIKKPNNNSNKVTTETSNKRFTTLFHFFRLYNFFVLFSFDSLQLKFQTNDEQ